MTELKETNRKFETFIRSATFDLYRSESTVIHSTAPVNLPLQVESEKHFIH